ncbi:hypothetical protein [Motilimonas cestriensis]|uniref:hypothetical protein n=1 Tax=Motilimonas cestriensis TaxID=2742685 RepID=UPI003DA4E8BB
MKNQLQPFDYSLVCSSFEDHTEAFLPLEEGNYSISTHIGEKGETRSHIDISSENGDTAFFIMPSTFKMKGFRQEDEVEQDAFCLSFTIKIRFCILNYDPNASENLLEDNRNLIKSHVCSVLAITAQRLLDVTKYRHIDINLGLI